jgi:hypothetical protein
MADLSLKPRPLRPFAIGAVTLAKTIFRFCSCASATDINGCAAKVTLSDSEGSDLTEANFNCLIFAPPAVLNSALVLDHFFWCQMK